MTTAGRRSRSQAQATRARLLDAAFHIFARDGYEKATVDDVVREAGYSKGAFYVHFRTKEEVFLALLDAHGAAPLHDTPAQQPPPLESPQTVFQSLLDIAQRDHGWSLMFYEFCAHAARNPVIAERLGRHFEGWRRDAAAALRRGQERGVVDPDLDVATAAAVLVAVAHGLPFQSRVAPQAIPADALSPAVAGLLNAWLQPKKERPAREVVVPSEQSAASRLDYNAVAESYEQHLDRTTGPFVTPLLEMARLRSGLRVLDVATGTGAAARRAARLVGATGYVLGVDRSMGMLDVARRAARGAGAAHLEFQEMDAASLSLPDGSFDVALCGMSLPEFPSPGRALREVARVLKRGGRMVVSTWSAPERVLLLQMVERAIAEHFPGDVSPSDVSPFAYSAPKSLENALTGAGVQDVEVRRERHVAEFSSRDDIWDAARSISPRLHALLQQAQPDVREAVRKGILSEAERYLIGGTFRLAAEAVVAAGVMPA